MRREILSVSRKQGSRERKAHRTQDKTTDICLNCNEAECKRGICKKIRKAKTMRLKVKLDCDAKMPTRAHETDAGLDIYSRGGQFVRAYHSAIFDTGVHIEIPEGYVGFLKSKSGLNVKHDITNEGVIDAGYTGSIVVKLYNNSNRDYWVEKGDKISQLVILPIITPELKQVENLEETERRP